MPHKLGESLDLDQFNPFRSDADQSLIMNWTTMQQIYPNLSKYGGPTFILPIQIYYVIGTAKGAVLIFNTKQFVQTVLTPNVPEFRSQVINIDLNQDGTHLCAAYESGDIFLWDLNANNDDTSQNHLFSVLHIDTHHGQMLNGLGFIPGRHTTIVASDSTGTIMLHKGTRNHLWQLIPTSKLLMRLNPMKNPLVMTKVRNCDSENQLMAVLSSRSFAVLSLAPEFSTKVMIDIKSWNSSDGFVAWNEHDSNMVAFSFENTVKVLKVDNCNYEWIHKTEENICKVSWLTKEIISVLTVSSRLLFLNTAGKSQEENLEIMSLDLLVHDLMVPNSQNHLSITNLKLVMLTNYSLKTGKFNTWSDIVLHYIHKSDYIRGLGTLGFFLQTSRCSTLFELLKLEANYEKRKQQIEPSFCNLALASINFLKNRKDLSYDDLSELVSLIIRLGSLFSEASSTSLLEKIADVIQEGHSEELFEIIYENICDGSVSFLGPTLFKSIIERNVKNNNSRKLETILLSLDPTTLDLDFAFYLCKNFHLYDTLIHLWIKLFDDYMTPLIDSINFFAGNYGSCIVIDNGVDKSTPFNFIKSVLVGKIYPTEDFLEAEKSLWLKNEFYSLIFHGSSLYWPPNSKEKLLTQPLSSTSNEPGFPYATLFLNTDPGNFLDALDDAFEDVDFNDSPSNGLNFTRQNIVDILIDIAHSSNADELKLHVAIFACRNIPKFSQFIRVSSITVEELIGIILGSDIKHLDDVAENSLEAIFSVYSPKDIYKLIEMVRAKGYEKALLILLKKSNNFADYLSLILQNIGQEEDGSLVLDTLSMSLEGIRNTPIEQVKVLKVISENFEKLLSVTSDVKKTVSLIEKFDPKLHEQIFHCKDNQITRQYLECFFDGTYAVSNHFLNEAKTKYLLLLYQARDFDSILTWIKRLDFTKSDSKDLMKIVDEHGDMKTSICLLIEIQDYDLALKRINDSIKMCLKESCQTDLDQLIELGVFVARRSPSNENWVKLISNMMIQYPILDENGKTSLEKCLQKVFIELSDSIRSSNDEIESNHFWQTIMQIFENQELILSKVKDLKTVLQNIYAAYSLEETLKTLVLRILDVSTRNELSTYIVRSEKGWPIKSHECDVCGKKLWGYGIDDNLFHEWERSRLPGNYESNEGEFLVFSCGHSFHTSCLRNLGQHKNFKCLTCNKELT